MVTSSPLSKTRAAASGSIQMLNSADGVWFPSWIAPPMSTTRSIFCCRLGMRLEEQGDVGERAERDERDGSVRSSDLLRQEVLRVPGDGLGARRREVDAVEPGLAVGVGCDDELARREARPRRRRRRISVRPASSRTRSAFAVVLSSVWFPATAVTPRTSSSGLPSARRSASASSWPGSQSMRTGITRVRQSRSAKSRFSGFRSGSVP